MSNPLFKISLGILLGSVLFTSACNTTSKVPSVDPAEKAGPEAFQQMIGHQVEADWFSARLRLAYSDQAQSVKANGTVHLREDSLIWINVRKLGFEVARVQITPDSIFIIDRLNNQYVAEDLGYLDRTFQVPVNFSMLQSLLLGNPILYRLDGIEEEESSEGVWLRAPDEKVSGAYRLSIPDYLLSQMILHEKASDRKISITMDEYDLLPDQQNFSYFRKINLKENLQNVLDMELRFSQIEVNEPQQLKFVIPERYTRVR